ncbi:MAG: rhodanese-like domain-containing protein [Candidatus Kariarchaeaceae archaeon]|jgi:rhodanese-related sulfurtransferase
MYIESTQLQQTIRSDEVLDLMNQGVKFIFLDIRMEEELIEFGWIPDSIHVDMIKFNNNLPDEISSFLDTGQKVIVYCSGGGRSLVITSKLREWGITALSLSDGYFGWLNSNGKIITQLTN